MSIVKVKFGTTQSPPKYSCDRVAVAAQRQCHVLQSLPSKRHVQPKHIFAQEGAPIRGWKVSSSLRGRPTYEEELAAPILGVQWQSLKSEAKT